MQKRVLIALALVIAVTIVALTLWRFGRSPTAPGILQATVGFTHAGWDEAVLLDNAEELRYLEWGLGSAEEKTGNPANFEPPFYTLDMVLANQTTRSLALMHDLRVYDLPRGVELFLGQDSMELLQRLVARLKEQRFGQLMEWNQVNDLFARYDVARIIDVETGLSFRTQRRGGTFHADIQPLSRDDTAVLKQIYDGKWSWDRRAVILDIDGQRIAASMNGMPHGGGALANGFPGHHCLHYLGSITHGGRNRDPAHQLMVHRAAGLLHSYMDQLNPADLQQAVLEMAGQGETDIVQLGTLNSSEADLATVQLVKNIRNIKIWKMSQEPPQDGTQIGHYSLSVYYVGNDREYRINLTMISRYIGEQGRWLVDPGFIKQLTGSYR